MNSKLFLLIIINVLLINLISETDGSLSFVQQFFRIFKKNTQIRANPSPNMRVFGDVILRGIESKRCEDALCLDCVPGFCRERPVPSTRPPTLFNRNGTAYINGFPNITVSAVPSPNSPPNGAPNINNNGIGIGVQQFMSNVSQVIGPQNLQDMTSLSNFFRPNSSSNGPNVASDANLGLLSSDISTTNSTGGPPIMTSTAPPRMCVCSWI